MTECLNLMMSKYRPAAISGILLAILLLTSAGKLHAHSWLYGENNDAWLMTQVVDGDTLKSNHHYSGGIYAYGEFKSKNLTFYNSRAGFMVLAQLDNNNENDYFGIDAGAGLLFGNRFSIFTGTGLLVGETDFCTQQQIKQKTCRESTVLGLYPEVGLRLKPTETTLIGIFIRKYSLNKEVTNFIGHGIALGFRF